MCVSTRNQPIPDSQSFEHPPEVLSILKTELALIAEMSWLRCMTVSVFVLVSSQILPLNCSIISMNHTPQQGFSCLGIPSASRGSALLNLFYELFLTYQPLASQVGQVRVEKCAFSACIGMETKGFDGSRPQHLQNRCICYRFFCRNREYFPNPCSIAQR